MRLRKLRELIKRLKQLQTRKHKLFRRLGECQSGLTSAVTILANLWPDGGNSAMSPLLSATNAVRLEIERSENAGAKYTISHP
jgi:hypothetical protein